MYALIYWFPIIYMVELLGEYKLKLECVEVNEQY
jgi:hypothetical protein